MERLHFGTGDRTELFSRQGRINSRLRQPFRVAETARCAEHCSGMNHGESIGGIFNSITHQCHTPISVYWQFSFFSAAPCLFAKLVPKPARSGGQTIRSKR